MKELRWRHDGRDNSLRDTLATREPIAPTTDPTSLWYVCKDPDSTLDYFIAELEEEATLSDFSFDRICNGNTLAQVASQTPVITPFGEKRLATIHGAFEPAKLTYEEIEKLSHYLGPKDKNLYIHPEVISFASSFKNADYRTPINITKEELLQLDKRDPNRLRAVVGDFIDAGIKALENTSQNQYINITASRLRSVLNQESILNTITPDIDEELNSMGFSEKRASQLAPDPHSIVYIPNFAKNTPHDEIGNIIIPLDWVEIAVRRPIPALAHLLRAASYVRDDSSNNLQGNNYYFNRELGGAMEIPKTTQADLRSEALIALFLQEVYELDQQQYKFAPHLDNLTHEIRRRYPNGGSERLLYNDPPDRPPIPNSINT